VQFQATPMVVKQLELRNAQVLPAAIAQQIFQPQIGQAIQPSRLDQGVRSINQWYAENGYSLSRAIDVEPNRNGTLKLTVKEGTIDELTIRFVDEFGRTVDDAGKPIKGKTKESFIRQEIKAKPGEIFQAAKVQADLQNLLKTGLFINANASLEGDDDRTRVVYNVAEGNNRQANLGGGYNSDSGLFGSLTYNDANLAGKGNQLGGRVLVGSKDLQFNGKFTKPFRESDPQRWGYSINAFRERGLSRVFDDDVLLSNGDAVREGRVGAGFGLTKALGNGWNGSIDLNYARTSHRDASGNVVQTDSLGNPLSVSGRGIDDQVTLGFATGYNRLDNPIDPKSGSKLQLSTEQGLPIGVGSTFSNKLSAEYTQYLPVNLFNKNNPDRDKQEVLAFNLQGGTTIGTLAPYKAFTLGGVNSVRGYGQGELGIGRSYVQASAEYRFPLISALGGAVFADFATDLGSAASVPGAPGTDRARPGSGFGAGVGLRYKSPLGVLRADWGFTDSGNNRLQFTIGQKF
jgi:outer membrane protein insertion porin family